MNRWGWFDAHAAAEREFIPRWLRPLSAAVPWVTVLLLFMMMYVMGGAFTTSEGALFSLPEKGVGDVADASAVALVLPAKQGTLVFFDDTRYLLEDEAQLAMFGAQLKERVALAEAPTLLVLADRRVSIGDLMKLAAVAKENHVAKTLFAEKRGRAEE